MAYLYIIQGQNEFHYCGITLDIIKRWTAHNAGNSKSTRAHLPYMLKYLKEVKSMSQARVIEKIIKSCGVKLWLYKQQGKLHLQQSEQRIESLLQTKYAERTSAYKLPVKMVRDANCV